MNKLVKILLLAGLSVQVVRPTKGNDFTTRAEREIRMGERAIIYSLATASRQYIDQSNGQPVENWGVEQGELGLALIASNHDSRGNLALVSLVRFKLDGGLGEDLHCYIAERGDRIFSAVKSIDPLGISGQCVREIRMLAPLNNEPGVGTRVCRTADEVQAERDGMLNLLKAKRKCGLSDF